MNTEEIIMPKEISILLDEIAEKDDRIMELEEALRDAREVMIEAYNYESSLVDERAITTVESALRKNKD